LLWPLSTAEAGALNASLRPFGPDLPDWGMYYWWLRSPGATLTRAASVFSYGIISGGNFGNGSEVYSDFNQPFAVRPAFWLRQEPILFVSPAEGGKTAEAGGEWKLTLLDETRSGFTAAFDSREGSIWTIRYSGATAGENENISAVIKNADGEVTHYGVLGAAQEGENTVRINVSDKLSDGDTLYVFSEQINGDKKTDYAGALQAITDPYKAIDLLNETRAMSAGSEGLQNGVNTADAPTIWYGGNAWRVVGGDGAGVAPGEGRLTLLSGGAVSYTYFTAGHDNDYAGSFLQQKVDEAAAALSAGEQSAVVPRTLETDGIAGDPVENALLWPLSTAEAVALNASLRPFGPDLPDWGMYYWWLRSPGGAYNYAACVEASGTVDDSPGQAAYSQQNFNQPFAVRPAFWLRQEPILFVSPAEGGKTAEAGGEWKLTLLDETRGGFTAAFDSREGSVWTIRYSGATAGENENISAVIKNADGEVTHYGVLGAAQEGENTVCVYVGEKLKDGDTLYVFSEQINGDKKTDFAGAPQAITPPPEEPSEEPPEEPSEEPSEESSEEPSEPSVILKGDANRDGCVDMKDVLTMRKYIAHLTDDIDLAAADVNGDGSVDMKDVLLIRKYIAGLIESL
ncbi:MAG: dockerin type I repeat-containing protein, partial [Clostridia bacterium]|nr:dockerin type I repeat-containing protein [Clostridia bacterium]